VTDVALLNPTQVVPALQGQIELVQEYLEVKEEILRFTKMTHEEYIGTFAAARALREVLAALQQNYERIINK